MIKKNVKTPSGQMLLWNLVIVAVSVAAFFPGFFNRLTNWDDTYYIVNNPHIQAFSWENIKWIFSNSHMANYHPLTMLSLAFDYSIMGSSPFIYHFTNVLLHCANSVLVFFLIYAITGRMNLSVIASLLFGVHTLHVESVAWVSERKDVLYTMFYLASLYCYTRFVKEKSKKWYLLSLFLFLLSLLSKGQAVTLALTLFLVDYILGKKLIDRKNLIEKIPFLLLSLVFGIIAIKSQQTGGGTNMVVTDGSQRIFFASYGFMMYIARLALPVKLSAYYGYPDFANGVALPAIYYLAPLALAGFLVALYFSYNRSRPVFFGMAFFLVNIFLLLQLLPIGGAVMADRYTYIPSVGYCFLFGFVVLKKEFLPDVRIAYAIVALYLLLLGALTFSRTMIWKSSYVLWSDVVSQTTNVAVAWNNHGEALLDSTRYKEALSDFDKAIQLDPKYNYAYINRGFTRSKLNDHIGAIRDLDLVIARDSSWVEAYCNRAVARTELKDYSGALHDYNRAVALRPGKPEYLLFRGKSYTDLKEYQLAIDDFNALLAINPKMTDGYTARATVYKLQNNMAAALEDYNTAITVDPSNTMLYNNRGNTLFQMGRTREAIGDYNTSITLKPGEFLTYKNRGAVYYSLKEFKPALADFSEAIRLNGNAADLYYTRALIRKELNDSDGAKADFAKAVSLDPSFAAAAGQLNLGLAPAGGQGSGYMGLCNEAQAAEMQGKFPDAIRLYKKSLDLNPGYAEGWYHLGTAYAKSNQMGEAVKYFSKALEIRKDYVEVMTDRGLAKASMGKRDDALKDMNAAIAMNPGFSRAYFNRALIYLNSQQKDLACADLQKAVQLGSQEAYGVYRKVCQGK